jgi:hypothetical protein
MKRKWGVALLLMVVGIAVCSTSYAQTQTEKPGAIGVRFGLGTDISGGIAYGAQLNYTLFQLPNAIEMGLALYGGKFEEESDNGFNVYKEETTVFVFAAMVNYLFLYSRDPSGVHFLAGVGVGAVSVEWEERSDTDSSLGTPLPGGGSMQSEEGTTAGLLLNFGLGYRFTELFDLRAQVPVLFVSGGEERDGKVVPMITVTAGLTF